MIYDSCLLYSFAIYQEYLNYYDANLYSHFLVIFIFREKQWQVM